jgi:hypothetical protein
MNLIKNLLERLMLALVAVAVAAVFHYYGGLTVPASLLLGVGFTIVGLWLYLLWKVTTFQPYSVEIFVNFDVLCDDLGLSRAPVDRENIVYEIYKFTALSAAVFAHHGALYAKKSEQMNDKFVRSETDYRTGMTFGNRVPCVLTPVQFDNPENRNPQPYFFFRQTRNGYSFGIRVVEKWWIEHRQQAGAPLRDSSVDPDGEIVLCVLPYGYIPEHVGRWESAGPFSLFDWRQRRWNAKLGRQGWSISESDPGNVEHRYLRIRYDLLFG